MSEALPAFQFYRETRFKKVELNGRKVRIPEEWEIKSIKDVVKKIKAGGTPKTSVREYYENGTIPFVKIEDLTESEKYLKKTKIFITESGLKNSNAWIVPENSLLFAMYGSIGASAITKIPVATNQAILGIIPDSSQAHIEFLYYLLKISVRDMKRQTKHGVQPNLTAKIVKEFKIPLPPLPEQKKIAEVLHSIDEAIQAVDESIARLERLKKGTMGRLLTRGINHTRFKTVELNGRKVEIPEEWEVVELGNPEYFEIVMGQSPPSSSYNKEGKGMPFIQGAAEFGHVYVRPQMSTTKPLKIAKKDDIIISVRAPVGDVNIAPFELCIGRGVSAIRPNKEKVDVFFLYYRMSTAKKDLERLGGGAVFRAITKNTLKNFQITLPPLEEQKKISEILRTIDETIEAKRTKKEKLERMKKAVMEKLLTGEIRVR